MPTFGSQSLGREIYCCPVQGLHFAASAVPAHTSPSPDFLMSSCVFFVTASRPPIASSKSALTFSSILFCWSSSFDISRLSGQQSHEPPPPPTTSRNGRVSVDSLTTPAQIVCQYLVVSATFRNTLLSQ